MWCDVTVRCCLCHASWGMYCSLFCLTTKAKGRAEIVVSVLVLVSEMTVVDEEGFKTLQCGAVR